MLCIIFFVFKWRLLIYEQVLQFKFFINFNYCYLINYNQLVNWQITLPQDHPVFSTVTYLFSDKPLVKSVCYRKTPYN